MLAAPTLIFEDDQSPRHQAVDGVDHHEGIATGRLMNGRRELEQALGPNRASTCRATCSSVKLPSSSIAERGDAAPTDSRRS